MITYVALAPRVILHLQPVTAACWQGAGLSAAALPACSDALHKDGSRLRIDLQDIKAFDEDLGHCLEQNPAEYLPAVRCTIKQA